MVGFALLAGNGTLRKADIALVGAVIAAGLGYAEGAVLARTLGAWQVICWTLVLALPLLLPIVWQYRPDDLLASPISAVVGFLYVSFFSQFFGYLAWYKGLSLGGIARVGQVQLVQPFLTIVASALLLKESVPLSTLLFALGVIICVAQGRKTQVQAP